MGIQSSFKSVSSGVTEALTHTRKCSHIYIRQSEHTHTYTQTHARKKCRKGKSYKARVLHVFRFNVHDLQSPDIKYHKLAQMNKLLSEDEKNVFCSDREVVPPVTAPGKEKGACRDFGPLPNGYNRPPQATLDVPRVNRS